MALMRHASAEYKYDLKPAAIAGIWRGGCIIRAALLEQVQQAYKKDAALPNLMVDDFFAAGLVRAQAGIRGIIQTGVAHSIPLAAFSVSLSYFDSYRRGWLPSNLIQAQRDYFGAHTYELVNQPRGQFYHTNWTGRGGTTASTSYNA